jgi:ABC-type multidrug transport system fused ATPase/permease subunit
LDPIPSSNYSLSIDGISLDRVDRTTLRERLIVVSQEPVFLPDGTTFKKNLDPTDTVPHQECQAALEAVGLWDLVIDRGGLAAGLTAQSLSQGHKQLFSLARAILRRRLCSQRLETEVGRLYLDPQSKTVPESEKPSKHGTDPATSSGGLLILDEYSSNLDLETDKMIQETVFREFQGYTILMVSHRLEMVMGFDKVVILDRGSLVEQGIPRDLVEQEGSRFRELWMAGKEK